MPILAGNISHGAVTGSVTPRCRVLLTVRSPPSSLQPHRVLGNAKLAVP